MENCGLLGPTTLHPPHLELHANSRASEAELLPHDPLLKDFYHSGGWPVPPQSARLSTVVCVSKRVGVRLQWFYVSLRSTVSQKGNQGIEVTAPHHPVRASLRGPAVAAERHSDPQKGGIGQSQKFRYCFR